jgi:hypothetical protein
MSLFTVLHTFTPSSMKHEFFARFSYDHSLVQSLFRDDANSERLNQKTPVCPGRPGHDARSAKAVHALVATETLHFAHWPHYDATAGERDSKPWSTAMSVEKRLDALTREYLSM